MKNEWNEMSNVEHLCLFFVLVFFVFQLVDAIVLTLGEWTLRGEHFSAQCVAFAIKSEESLYRSHFQHQKRVCKAISLIIFYWFALQLSPPTHAQEAETSFARCIHGPGKHNTQNQILHLTDGIINSHTSSSGCLMWCCEQCAFD